MFGFRKLDVYKCAVKALPLAYRFAERADSETKRQLRRAALAVNLLVRIVAMLTKMSAAAA